MTTDSYQACFLSVVTKINSMGTKCSENKVAMLLWDLTLLVFKNFQILHYISFTIFQLIIPL